MEAVYIWGIGRNTVTIMDLAEDCGYQIGGLFHYNHDRIGEHYFGHKIEGCFEDLLQQDDLAGLNIVLSMGDLNIRKSHFERILARGGNVPTLIHPSCIISKHAKIGYGAQIMPGTVVQGDVAIGDNTVVTVNTVIAHSVSVGSHCLISGNVMVGAYTNIGNLTHIGQGATIISGKVKNIGTGCILGAGSVLLSDMPDYTIYAGSPAYKLKDNVIYAERQ